MSADLDWYAARVSPLVRSTDHVEQFVRRRLGLKCWWPKIVQVQKRPRRGLPVGVRGGRRWYSETIERPLMPGYILVALPRERTPFRRFGDDEAQAHGLHGVLGNSGGPVIIPDHVVADLQAREAAGEWDRTLRHRRKLIERPPEWAVVGAKAEVTDGPFASFESVIDEVIGGRARVAVSIFGRSTPVDVELSQLRPRR